MKNNILPKQHKGAQTGAEAHREANSVEEARHIFTEARRRMLDISNWHRYGMPGSVFTLTDSDGRPVRRHAQLYDHIRIDLPGPGPVSGDGYDWVYIEAVKAENDPGRDSDFFAFRVRPVPNPAHKNKEGKEDADTSHFYTDDTTSTFILERSGQRVTAAEKGRNEVPNTQASGAADKIRNTLVAAGAAMGFASIQWKSLMEGWLDIDLDTDTANHVET